ncbi:NitT/TauT family transport system permease protein [Natronocella acetinitrilica]|uniref:NitT/TauT family transport system permease protein n=1 Tax=Natronocella acetinitrilica TaxID=414046 RepID=A0AAE3KD35_9GAMM|nr:NitT/TauT family transport system permease protein [Natronocella acetinitrilica]
MLDFRNREEIPPLQSRIIQIVTALVIIGGWELAAMNANPLLVPRPSSVAVAGWEMLLSGELLRAFNQSFISFGTGFLISLVFGIAIGVLMGVSKVIEKILDPYVNALYAMPIIALIPFIMLWVGIGFEAKVIIVVLFAIFPIIISTAAGVKNVDKHYLDIGVAFCASRYSMFMKIVAPSALPFVASGIRLAVGRGIIAMVVAEFLTAIAGLGGLIINYSNSFQTSKAFVPVIVLALMGIVLTYFVQVIEYKLEAWKRT